MYLTQDVMFTREQLIFIIETAMSSAFDQVHGSLPQNQHDVEIFKDELPYYRCGAINVVAIFVPILWAQTEGKRINDGMGTGDFPCWKEFENRCEEFVDRQLAGNFNQTWPEFRDLAEKIVDTCWNEYLQVGVL